MRAILAIFFFVVFGLIGMRLAGPLGNVVVNQQVFKSPDEHGHMLLLVNIGIAGAFALAGVLIGLLLAPPLRRRLIRDED